MSKVRPSKVRLCRFKNSYAIEWGQCDPLYYEIAEKAIKTLNDAIAGPNGELDNEFWFLNATIKKETHIITGNYPSNDPEFLEKLHKYIDDNSVEFPVGTKYSRKKFKQVSKGDLPQNPVEIVTHDRTTENDAQSFCDRLRKLIGKNGSCNYAPEGGKYRVYLQSAILNRDQLYAILNAAKKA